MPASTLRRTVRRGVAVLLLPLSLLLVSAGDPAAVPLLGVPGVSYAAGVLGLLAAASYLLASVGRQAVDAADTPF